MEIRNYYEEEAKSLQLQINMRDVSESEKTNIFHHSLHRKKIQKSAILKIQEEGNILLGHKACSDLIQNKVAELLENPIEYNKYHQEELLNEISPVFSDEDNLALMKIPDKTEVYETLKNSNLMAAPGSDGITNYLYLKLFHCLGDILTNVIIEIFKSKKPTLSQRTCLMVFAGKPGKKDSMLLKDKRKISLLNNDFKLLTGIANRRHNLLYVILISNLHLIGLLEL